MTSSCMLFVYGTLMRNRRRHGLLVRPGVRFVGFGRIQARLYELPGRDYPAAVPSGSPREHVQGEVYSVTNAAPLLRLLDQVEGCREGLFQRQEVEVRFAGTSHKAWIYFFHQPLSAAKRIASGRFGHTTSNHLG